MILRILTQYFLCQLVIGSILFVISLFGIDFILTGIQKWIPVSHIMRGFLFGCYTFGIYRLTVYLCFDKNKYRKEILELIEKETIDWKN